MFEYCEVSITVTRRLTTTCQARYFGKPPKEIDSPFDYMKDLGFDGWEVINLGIVDNSEGSARCYVFKRKISV